PDALPICLDLINRLAPGILSDNLGVPTEFSLATLDWRQAWIERVRLGKAGALAIDGIRLSYDPWSRRLERVEIDRVALAADYDSGFSLGDLDPLVARLRGMMPSESGTDAGAPLPILPTIIVEAIVVDLRSPAGLLRGSGQATLDNQAIVGQFSLAESNGHAGIDADIALSLADNGAPPSGALRARLEAASALWNFIGVAPPCAGQV